MAGLHAGEREQGPEGRRGLTDHVPGVGEDAFGAYGDLYLQGDPAGVQMEDRL